MKRNIIWKIILILGILPFVVSLGFGIYSAITGFSGLCILNCKDIYGIQAFLDSIIMYSYIFWPTYIVGLIAIITSVIFIKRRNNNKSIAKQ